jgi:amino acid adenylation domain-containing protein
MSGWNGTDGTFPREACVQELVAAQAARTPGAPAVVADGCTLSYHELDRCANQLAHHLQRLGVGPEVRVGVCAERSLELMIGLLAVLKAGGVYLPLDPAYPRERLSFLVADGNAAVLLVQPHLRDLLRTGRAQLVVLDPPDQGPTRAGVGELRKGESPPATGATPDNLAYVMYTSGSTGSPKGVAMTHRALCNMLTWQVERSNLQSGARTLQFSSSSFDVSLQEVLATWSSGGTLVLISEQEHQDVYSLWRRLVDTRVNRLFLPPVALQQLAEVAQGERQIPGSLREVIAAGEQLRITPGIVELFSRLTDCSLYNQYGPSESHAATEFGLTGPPAEWTVLTPIGHPIADAQVHVLDPQMQPVPVGVPGELYIGGVGVARGYLDRPELTAERFLPDPFGGVPGARLYRTGDLGRYRPDGALEFLGRIDHQVKIRGFRVEPGEVEATLGRHPAVRECVVVARTTDAGSHHLVAYIGLQSRSEPPGAGELRSFLKGSLPEYMIPTTFVALARLPLTPTGKVDRNALPPPESSRPEVTAAFALPRTPLEHTLALMWAEILGLERVGIDDNFFELGGHSLLATQVASRVRETLRVELPLRQLFEAPTVAELATVLTKHVQPHPASVEGGAQSSDRPQGR